MAVWPGTLPQDVFVGATRGQQTGFVRSEMDTGPPKMRKKFTAVVINIQSRMVFTGAQLVVFWDFYNITLDQGVLTFDWKDPLDDSSKSLRFVASPDFALVSGHSTSADAMWEGVLFMEVLP